MGLEFALVKELEPKIWDAKGMFEAPNGMKGEVDVLVEQVDDKSVKLILNSRLKLSKIANREVLLYTNVKPEECETKVQAGAKVKVKNNLWFNLKK